MPSRGGLVANLSFNPGAGCWSRHPLPWNPSKREGLGVVSEPAKGTATKVSIDPVLGL